VWKPQRYDDVEAYLASHEGISVQAYNQRQLDLLKSQNTIEAPDLQAILAEDASDLDFFSRGTIRPQLIIHHLHELSSWLVPSIVGK
jgi:hypothetical protein